MKLKLLALTICSFLPLAAFANEQTGPAIREAKAHGTIYKFSGMEHEEICQFSGTVPVFDWRQAQDVAMNVIGTCASHLGGEPVNVLVDLQVLIVEKEGQRAFKSAHAGVRVIKVSDGKNSVQAYSAAAGTPD
ncbi:MAG: hypothetical protein EOP11_16955, partial [Proteobacteria bacterium]